MSDRDRDLLRIEELLIDRALGELTPDQDRELAVLLADEPGMDSSVYERVVAEMSAALLTTDITESLPADVATAVVARSGNPTTEIHTVEADDDEPVQDEAADGPATVTPITAARSSSGRWVSVGGWIAAAAALVGWIAIPGAFTDGPTGPRNLAELRESLVSGGAEIVRVPWTATEDPAAVAASGDVVWSTSLQTGFMRFAGLEANDPTVFQYQLWIFDATRDERFPVDGGVFDVGPDGEVIVQIDPKVDVRDPSLFAVTIEQPGGVVVSDRERIVLVAEAG